MKNKALLWLEWGALYVALPVFIYVMHSRLLMIAVLWGGAALCALFLWRDAEFDHRAEWNARALRQAWKPILARCAAVAIFMAAFCYFLTPDKFLDLPKHRPQLWIIIMFVYPLLSVVPQEIIFRSFFFHRYRALFPKWLAYIIAAAFAFGFMHIIFGNWIAVAFTVPGGFLLAHTYFRYRSMALVSLEHALYGCTIFTVGLGQYFFNH